MIYNVMGWIVGLILSVGSLVAIGFFDLPKNYNPIFVFGVLAGFCILVVCIIDLILSVVNSFGPKF